MAETVLIPIPVEAAAAEVLRADPRRCESIGRLVSRMVAVQTGGATEGDPDPLLAFLAHLPRDPEAPPLTAAEIEAEIAAHRAERRP